MHDIFGSVIGDNNDGVRFMENLRRNLAFDNSGKHRKHEENKRYFGVGSKNSRVEPLIVLPLEVLHPELTKGRLKGSIGRACQMPCHWVNYKFEGN